MKLATYDAYQKRVEKTVAAYCETAAPVVKDSQYLEVLQTNTDRIQGSLVLAGYDLCGGSDHKMIDKAALAIELFHAYVQCLALETDTRQALRAQHEAEIILANLEVDPGYRIKALSITNRTMMLVQSTYLNPLAAEKSQWQATAVTLNPVHVGQVLAGAGCEATNAVTPLLLETGTRLFEKNEIDMPAVLRDLQAITW